MAELKPAQQPVRALAYLGDAVYELHVRERTVRRGGNVHALHRETVAHVSAAGQAQLAQRLLPNFTEEEADVFRRARNHKTATPRRVSGQHYNLSTAFEAVLGYLYLKGEQTRLAELLAIADSLEEETHAD